MSELLSNGVSLIDSPKSSDSGRSPKSSLSTNLSESSKSSREDPSELPPIKRLSLKPEPLQVSSNTGFEVLCSYNWLPGPKPSIIVPGGAPVWRDPELPIQMQKDSGPSLIDANAAFSPTSTFEPMFQALTVCNPDFKFTEVDLLVNRNSLRKLYDLARGVSTQAFELKAYVVDETLVIERSEKFAVGNNPDGRGYGTAFEKLCTTQVEELEETACHHRVIQYQIGSLNCVVRFEVDACVEEEIGDANQEATSETAALAPVPAADKKLGNIDVTVRAGHHPSLPLAEIKQASRKSRKSIGLALPQLWFGRVAYLKQGTHTDGLLGRVTCTNTKGLFQEWEERNQESLRGMVDLIRGLMTDLQGESSAVKVVWKGGSMKDGKRLELVQPEGATGKPISEDILKQFWK